MLYHEKKHITAWFSSSGYIKKFSSPSRAAPLMQGPPADKEDTQAFLEPSHRHKSNRTHVRKS